ncbi:MAG: molybdenum ABC transporter ATP-binding protein, partial [Proteobacteria bacterium]|nr:molybdenum ABC transporter ATP-binding protein [Pseudomonadota bacterium]
VVADGPKDSILTNELLSSLYETEIRVARVDGFFLAYPGN